MTPLLGGPTSPTPDGPPSHPRVPADDAGPELVTTGAFDVRQLVTSIPQALRKLTPRAQARNPVMFVVYLGAIVTTVLAVWHPSWFSWTVACNPSTLRG